MRSLPRARCSSSLFGASCRLVVSLVMAFVHSVGAPRRPAERGRSSWTLLVLRSSSRLAALGDCLPPLGGVFRLVSSRRLTGLVFARSGLRPLESWAARLPCRRHRAGVSSASAGLLVVLQLGWRPCSGMLLTPARPAPFLASLGGCTLTHTFWPKYGVYGRRLTPKPADLEGSLTHTLR